MLTDGSSGMTSGIAHVTVKDELNGGREMIAFLEREPTVYPETRAHFGKGILWRIFYFLKK